MKKLILLLFIALGCFMPNQVLAEDTDEIVVDTVIQVPGVDAAKIYSCLRLWFIEAAKYDSRAVLQVDKEDEGLLQGRMSQGIEFRSLTWKSLTGYISAIIDVRIRDGRYKMRMYNFEHRSIAPQFTSQWSQGIIYKKVPSSLTGLKKAPYNRLLSKALPLIDEWTKSIIEGSKKSITVPKSSEDDW